MKLTEAYDRLPEAVQWRVSAAATAVVDSMTQIADLTQNEQEEAYTQALIAAIVAEFRNDIRFALANKQRALQSALPVRVLVANKVTGATELVQLSDGLSDLARRLIARCDAQIQEAADRYGLTLAGAASTFPTGEEPPTPPGESNGKPE